MEQAYITVTLEVSGDDAEVLEEFHANLGDILGQWRRLVRYAELTIAYQDRAQVEGDAVVEADERDPWRE